VGANPPTCGAGEREGFVSPGRTVGGQRRYSRRQLRQLKDVAQLADEGITAIGIRKVLQLQRRIDELQDELATRDAAGQPGVTPDR
jgi:MerR family transcriptional regulator/heat shock protein HspR